MIEAVIFYVDPKSVGPLNFLGKERIPFPATNEHFLLTVFKKKFAEFAGLKAEAEKRDLGSGICRLGMQFAIRSLSFAFLNFVFFRG